MFWLKNFFYFQTLISEVSMSSFVVKSQLGISYLWVSTTYVLRWYRTIFSHFQFKNNPGCSFRRRKWYYHTCNFQCSTPHCAMNRIINVIQLQHNLAWFYLILHLLTCYIFLALQDRPNLYMNSCITLCLILINLFSNLLTQRWTW